MFMGLRLYCRCMSAKATQTEVENEAETNKSGVEAAYEAVDEALQQLSIRKVQNQAPTTSSRTEV